jgi:hypothetical protein
MSISEFFSTLPNAFGLLAFVIEVRNRISAKISLVFRSVPEMLDENRFLQLVAEEVTFASISDIIFSVASFQS